jgi:hypothetical protein
VKSVGNLKLLWSAFALISALTPIIYRKAFAVPGYFGILFFLAIATIVLATAILRNSSAKRWAIPAVLVGALIGQWWLIKSAIVLLFMLFGQFAP